MAKRKRLTPADPDRLETPALEVKSAFGAAPAPIASVASEAATAAALEEVTQALSEARREGRIIERLAIEKIKVDHLTRDRLGADAEEMAALKASIAARGQQTPIEVVALKGGQYGLISGWRRLQALSVLAEEAGTPGTVDALIRSPEAASDAYVAMVEENEIRANLSYFERARIALKAVEQGAFPDTKAALLELFSTASRAKRSKIRSFLGVVEALDGALVYPHRLPERLGLKLAKALEQDPAVGPQCKSALLRAKSDSAEAELQIIESVLKPETPKERSSGGGQYNVKNGVRLRWEETSAGALNVRLEGKQVDSRLLERLKRFLDQL